MVKGACLFGLLFAQGLFAQNIETFNVNTATLANVVSPFYRGYNVDLSRNREFFDIKFTEARLDYLAQSLGPSFLRVGGTGNDYVEYEFGGLQCNASSRHRIAPKLGHTEPATQKWNCVNRTQWDGFNVFARRADAKLIFGLNIQQRTNFSDDNPMGNWDPTNARALLEYSIQQGYSFWGLELGNEQSDTLTSERMAEDFLALRMLVNDLWSEPAWRPRLLGPDLTSLGNPGRVGPELEQHDAPILNFTSDFARRARAMGVGLHAITHHEYIESNVSTAVFAWKLDTTAAVARAFVKAVRDADPDVEPWTGEIGPHNGGSPPCTHDYERWANWADSLWYADALGAKAVNGVKAFCRQDFVGADYGLVDCKDHTPTPDYFTALLWGRLMGQGVLNTTATGGVRTYAHCGLHGDGAVTLVAINLGGDEVVLTTGALQGPRMDYVLTGTSGLSGLTASLNGVELLLTRDDRLPELPGNFVQSGNALVLPAQSVTFAEFPEASAEACIRSSSAMTIA